MTPEQLACLAEAAEGAHDNYGMSFYTPPSTDRIAEIEREFKQKLNAKELEFRQYQHNAETAIKQALRQHPDESVSIREYGEVERHGGRTERIQ